MKTMKAIQITWNGEPLKKIYPHATRWQVFKYKTMKLVTQVIKTILVTAIVSGGLLTAYKIGQLTSSKSYSITSVMSRDNLPKKIADFKSSALASLSGCEAPGYVKTSAPIILDTNKKMSIGPYMFQVATVQQYYKSLYNQNITPLQATLIALDYTSSTALANDIIFGVKGGIGNWYNCSNKLNLQAKIDVIQQLQS